MKKNVESHYYIQMEDKRFFIGENVHVVLDDGGGSSGTISHITIKGVYLHTGNKKDTYYRFDIIGDIYSMQ